MSAGFSLAVLLAAVVLMVVPSSALKAEMRMASSTEVHLPPDWKHRFNVIAAVINDDEFQEGLRSLVRDKGSSPINYCLFTVVTCNENFIIESFNIDRMRGFLDFSKIPQGATSLAISNSIINEPLDLTKLPFWVKTIKFENIQFAVGTTKLTQKHSTLMTLVCRSCGITSVDWNYLPPLAHLDLSGNELAGFRLDKLPPALKLLNVSNCGIEADATVLRFLPTATLTLDLSHNKISGVINDVAFPTSMEYLDLSYNEIEGPLSFENMPFTLWFLQVSHNKLTGTIADLTQFLTLKVADFSYNAITSVRFDLFAPQLQQFIVRNNMITGTIETNVLVPTLLTLDVSSNQMTGPMDLGKLPPLLEHLDLSHNGFSGPVILDQFSENIRFIYLQHNKFTGNPDLTNLPVDVRRVLIYENDWESLMPQF